MKRGDKIEFKALSGALRTATVGSVRDGSWVVFEDGVRGCDVRRVKTVNGVALEHKRVDGAEYMAAWAAEEDE